MVTKSVGGGERCKDPNSLKAHPKRIQLHKTYQLPPPPSKKNGTDTLVCDKNEVTPLSPKGSPFDEKNRLTLDSAKPHS